MKHLLVIFVALAALAACSQGTTPEEEAAKAARAYYMRLAEGSPNDFVCGKVGADSMPADYRAQLLKACEQYMAKLDAQHKGVREVCVSENVGRRDTAQHLTYAFLLLCFNDSTREEITVPMVEVEGVWKMR